jgi:branched-subunit amino acid ABC-type transport system permease component
MGINIVVENAVSYIYGPNSVSLNLVHFPRYTLLLIFIVLSVLVYYFFKYTLHGITFKAISENSRIVKSLGIRSNHLLQIFFAVLFVFLVCVAFIILNQTGLRATDGIFYIVKWIWIMLLVGLDKKEYILLGALLYVLVEYFLFIQRGLPISYKETLILVVIVLVLLFKPEGLFSLRKRHI